MRIQLATLAISAAIATSANAALWRFDATCTFNTITNPSAVTGWANPTTGSTFSATAYIDDSTVTSGVSLDGPTYRITSVAITANGTTTTWSAPANPATGDWTTFYIAGMAWTLNIRSPTGQSLWFNCSNALFSGNWPANRGIAAFQGINGNFEASVPGATGWAEATIQNASLQLVPAPGAIALLGVAGLAGSRRRRA